MRLLALLSAATIAGCGFSAESNEARCRYEAEKATAAIPDEPGRGLSGPDGSNRRIKGMQLERSCMEAAGFQRNAKGQWRHGWLVKLGY